MQKPEANASKAGLNLQDVLFVLFKHKWKIFGLTLLGFAAAATVFVMQTPIYRSQAKLFVRYVRDTGSVDPYEDTKNPGGGGKASDSVINTEIEILNSLDLARQVADAVGVGLLSPGATNQDDAAIAQAAGAILKGLEVSPGQSSNVLYVSYGNTQRELAQTVLKKLVELYFEKHLAIHRSATAFEVVAKQADEVRERLTQTEKQLDKLRTDSGILSLAEATTALSSQRTKTQEDLIKAKADFAELQASLAAHGKDPGAELESSSNHLPAGGNAPNSPSAGNALAAPPPAQALTEYRAVMDLIAFLQKRDMELQIKFKPGNRLLQLNQAQLQNYDAKRRVLLAKYPELAAAAEILEKNPDSDNFKWNLLNTKARLAAISAKIEVYETHLKEIGTLFSKQYAIGAQIEEMDRRKQMEDAEYRSIAANLKNAKLNQTLDPKQIPNITVVQQPSDPVKTFDKLTKKIILGLAGGGLALGLALAFLIELVLVRKVNRPIEIQTRLQLPLLLSIPYIRKKDRTGLLLGLHQEPLTRATAADPAIPHGESQKLECATPSRQANHFILPYSETIRDRIIFNFEVNNVTHKPKLVAVTGLSEHAGTSTIAAGLAKSLSEIPGVKVLLADLSSYHPEDSPLFGEVPRHSLSGALSLAHNSQFRQNPQPLYYARAVCRSNDRGATTFSPLHLNELMPNLLASEYDYIIFDMPPLDQTSRTPTMAGLMDKVLLVLDAENTSRDKLLWGYSELVRGKADVSCIFNKTRTHAPGWLVG